MHTQTNPSNVAKVQAQKKKDLKQCHSIFGTITFLFFLSIASIILPITTGITIYPFLIAIVIIGLIWFYALIAYIIACVASNPRKSYAYSGEREVGMVDGGYTGRGNVQYVYTTAGPQQSYFSSGYGQPQVQQPFVAGTMQQPQQVYVNSVSGVQQYY